MSARVLEFPSQQQRQRNIMKQIAMAALLVAGVLLVVDFGNSALGNPLARLGAAA